MAAVRSIMRTLRYSINITLDGCCDHRVMIPDEAMHQHAAEQIAQADAMLLGRVTYELMEAGWRHPVPPGTRPAWTEPFAKSINATRKYVVSRSLTRVDWNSELLEGELGPAVQRFKEAPGAAIALGGVTLPRALAALGLIDEYEFVVHPRIVGRGPTLFAGLADIVDLTLVDRKEFSSGAAVLRYVPRA